MEILRRFNGDIHTKEALLEYLLSYFNEQIITETLKGNDPRSIGVASNYVTKAFEQLELDYAITPRPTENKNQAA